MSVATSLRNAAFAVVVSTVALGASACGDGKETKHAKIAQGPMPENESWTGVYFHPLYGYLHMVEEGPSVVGRWKRADQSKWGELSGTKSGNVLHYKWKEHTVGMVGASATTHGKGYFVYKMDKEDRPVLDGEFGLNEDEVGSDWHSVKQARMAPDIKSIGGDGEGIKPGGSF